MEVSADDTRLKGVALHPGEEIVGLYHNPPPVRLSVLVTSLGLHIVGANSSTYVPFESVTHIDTPTSKTESEDVALWSRDGSRITVPIRGEQGRFKDVFEFVRFMRRVLKDRI
jgi:hypothetical protein